MSHADRLAILRSLAVTAFAVYVQLKIQALSSELDAPVFLVVRAWLIANAHVLSGQALGAGADFSRSSAHYNAAAL